MLAGALLLSSCAKQAVKEKTETDQSIQSTVSEVSVQTGDASAQASMQSESVRESDGTDGSSDADRQGSAAAGVSDREEGEPEGSAECEEGDCPEGGSEKLSTVFFASDYQHRDGWKDPPDTLSGVLDAIGEAGIKIDNAVFCGDYTTENGHNNYNANPHKAIMKIKEILLSHEPELDIEKVIFVQGNHDQKNEDITETGLYDFGQYLVYVMNTEDSFPWRQGTRHLKHEVRQGALNLKKCLDELRQQGEERPVFLAGHVPLHFSGRTSKLQGTGDNLYAGELFRVINQEAEELNLVYLYGHNHSRGWDSYLGGSCVFRQPGDWLLIPQPEDGESTTSNYSKETIHFTYLNAGYVGYFSSAGGEETLTGTVCDIYQDHMEFSRYSEEGLHILSADGTPNPAKDDSKMIPRKYYGTSVESPAAVPLHAAKGAGADMEAAKAGTSSGQYQTIRGA